MNQIPEQGRPLRLLFEKCGPIRYISHLDLTRAFHRAFQRANLPLKFSEGFSPHPKFAFALPLSVGTESVVELADFTLKSEYQGSEEEIRAALQEQMPAGIRILFVGEQKEKFSEIAFASYTIRLPNLDPEHLPLLKQAKEAGLSIQKKNKKGKWVEKDISAGIYSIEGESADEGVILNAVLSAAGEHYLKPELIFDALKDAVPEEEFSDKSILRTGVFKSDMTPFHQ